MWIRIWNPRELVHAFVVERCDWPGMWGLLLNKIGARAYFTCVTASPSIPKSLEMWRVTTLSRHIPLDCGHGVRSEATFPCNVARVYPLHVSWNDSVDIRRAASQQRPAPPEVSHADKVLRDESQMSRRREPRAPTATLPAPTATTEGPAACSMLWRPSPTYDV